MFQIRPDATLKASGLHREAAVITFAMDDDDLRTRHVIAALVIGLAFAGSSAVFSPISRLRERFTQPTFIKDRGRTRRVLRRMDGPVA